MHACKGAGPRASAQAGHLVSLGVLQLWLVCEGTGPGASTSRSSSVAWGAVAIVSAQGCWAESECVEWHRPMDRSGRQKHDPGWENQ